ncbi:MAG: hypothetical protein IT584_01415 [Chlamydiae bacterium]|nr:hypothetical protein [Chlamydiota bacterium]
MKPVYEDDRHCFACGMENLDGLRIVWHTEGLFTEAEFTADRKFQGWKGLLHGGIVATLLDDAMTRLALRALRSLRDRRNDNSLRSSCANRAEAIHPRRGRSRISPANPNEIFSFRPIWKIASPRGRQDHAGLIAKMFFN